MNKKTILIVEDDKSLMQAMTEKLAREDYNLLKAFDGDEGLKIILEKHPDLILLDIVMPKMDGMTMLKKLHENSWGKQVPVIIVTNLSEEMQLEGDIEKSIVGYFVKSDWRLEDIVKLINKTLISVTHT